MSNSIIFFNCYLNLRGLSRFTLLSNFKSEKSSFSNSMFSFCLFKILYLNSFSALAMILSKKYDQYIIFFLFNLFFESHINVFSLGSNSKFGSIIYFWNVFFFKKILFVKTFFPESCKLIKNSVNNLDFLSLPYNFNNKLLSTSNHQFYNYLVIFFNLKNFYNFFLINVNLNYFYLHIAHDAVYSLVNFFKKNLVLTLKGLYDIFVIDYPSRLFRFELIYGFTSVYNGVRVFLKTHVSENISMCSISNVFSSANWLERECWDLFGVFFANHKNLRRILTDYGFRGFPFRKDFPLTGYIEVRFDDSLFSIVYEPLEISQEFRVFNFRSPWENYEL